MKTTNSARSRPAAFAHALGLVSVVGLIWAAPAAHARYSLEQLLKAPHFDAADIRAVRKGRFAVARFQEVSERELGVTIACLVNGSREEALRPFLEDRLPIDDEHLIDQQQIDPGNPVDSFEAISLSDNTREEIRRYINAEPGYGLNLSSAELALIKQLHGTGDAARIEAFVEGALLDRYLAYREAGLDGAQPYAREDGQVVMPGEELRLSEENMTGLHELHPAFHGAWLKYPASSPEGVIIDDYFWVELEVEERPTFLLSHRLASVTEDTTIVGVRDYYASHFFDVAQRAVAVMDLDSGARLLLYMERAWVDYWSGFVGVKKRLGSKVMTRQMEHLLVDRGICGD